MENAALPAHKTDAYEKKGCLTSKRHPLIDQITVCRNYFCNWDMITTTNANTNVRSIAPIMIHATTFLPTFCLAPLIIYSPPYAPVSIFIIVIVFISLLL